MKFLIAILLFILFSPTTNGQNLPACDSLAINCCTVNGAGADTISLTVSNTASIIFDYPGFVLFDSNMDTVAFETVNYFGIGINPQIHFMNIVAPLTLPFSGFLNLYTLFNASLACSFPITIPDTITGISVQQEMDLQLQIVPNPVNESIFIKFVTKKITYGEATLKITNMQGKQVKIQSINVNSEKRIEVDSRNIFPGIYLL